MLHHHLKNSILHIDCVPFRIWVSKALSFWASLAQTIQYSTQRDLLVYLELTSMNTSVWPLPLAHVWTGLGLFFWLFPLWVSSKCEQDPGHRALLWKKYFKFQINFHWKKWLKIQYFPHLRSKNYEIISIKSYSLSNFQ
jgi:hypothetical protein